LRRTASALGTCSNMSPATNATPLCSPGGTLATTCGSSSTLHLTCGNVAAMALAAPPEPPPTSTSEARPRNTSPWSRTSTSITNRPSHAMAALNEAPNSRSPFATAQRSRPWKASNGTLAAAVAASVARNQDARDMDGDTMTGCSMASANGARPRPPPEAAGAKTRRRESGVSP
jgi:hypothetical protein